MTSVCQWSKLISTSDITLILDVSIFQMENNERPKWGVISVQIENTIVTQSVQIENTIVTQSNKPEP